MGSEYGKSATSRVNNGFTTGSHAIQQRSRYPKKMFVNLETRSQDSDSNADRNNGSKTTSNRESNRKSWVKKHKSMEYPYADLDQ